MKDLISQTIHFVQQQLENAESGHDWWHVVRVHALARQFAIELNANLIVVELAALLHDIADSKFHNGNEETGPALAAQFLEIQHLDSATIQQVVYIIRHMSFKHSFSFNDTPSLEFQVVQDADRLDAIGAIGIARAFSYGGFKQRPFFDPEIAPQHYTSTSQYSNSKAPTINHFYEKLLLLKDRMNTGPAKKLAEKRHDYMVNFLRQFDAEWNGLC
ncbi:MAG: HD domain-containing protein [Bacteroidales bacterium]|nr:HD domain-containing protein [Bacteroidales bacterium]